MALIKGKQILSVPAAKVVETADKKFVTDAQIADFSGKATVDQVATAKQEAIDGSKAATDAAVLALKTELEQKITDADAAKVYTDQEVAKVQENLDATELEVAAVKTTADDNVLAISALDGRVGANEAAIQDRYTKSQVDTKLAEVATGIKYKGTVASFAEIATKFPTPAEGWLVAVEGTKKFFVYDADTATWEEFPLIIEPNTTYANTLRITVVDNQTAINTGIKTDGTGSYQTSATTLDDINLFVNGLAQTKDIDYSVAEVASEIVITWISSDFQLEGVDVVKVIYNQTI